MAINNLVDRNLKANVTNSGAGAGLDAQSFQNFLGAPALSNTFKVSLGLSNNSSGSTNSDLNSWLVSAGVFNKSSPARFDFLCSEASLPGTNLASFEETGARQGVTEFFANSRAYVDLNLRFYLSSDYQVLKLFQEWINFINPVYASTFNPPANSIISLTPSLSFNSYRIGLFTAPFKETSFLTGGT